MSICNALNALQMDKDAPVYSDTCGSFLTMPTFLFVDPNDCEDEDICGPYGECVDLPIRYYCNCQIGYYFYEDTGQCESEVFTPNI